MKTTLNPGWLVSLMCQWARRELAMQDRSLGYPRKAAGFSEKTTGGYNHSDPVAFQARDFTDLERALELLREEHPEQMAAMVMYYKPWAIRALREEGWPFGNSTYYDRLHRAHAWVAMRMDREKIAA
jgi:hypothetical protein